MGPQMELCFKLISVVNGYGFTMNSHSYLKIRDYYTLLFGENFCASF